MPLVALALANAVSLLGNVVAVVAIPWLVLTMTGSAALMGVAAFATTLPLAFGAIAGGAIVDRVGPRATSIAADLMSCAAVAGIPLLDATGRLELWHLLVLGFLGSLLDAPGQAAREALLPPTAERSGTSLERATALWTTTEHVGYLLGAPVAGLVIAAAGAPAALWVDAASFVVCAGLVAVAVPSVRAAVRPEPYLAAVATGVRFVAKDAVLRAFLLLATVGNFFIAPLAPVLLPVYAREVLTGPRDLGLLVGAYGAGGLVGAVAFGAVGARLPRRALFVGVWTTYPLLCVALIALPRLLVAAVVLFLIGLVAGADGPLEQVVRQERTPPELRGRVFATFMAALTLVVPLSMLIAGLVLETAGLRAAFVAFAVGNSALALFALTSGVRRAL